MERAFCFSLNGIQTKIPERERERDQIENSGMCVGVYSMRLPVWCFL